jgi:hypothetical protein
VLLSDHVDLPVPSSHVSDSVLHWIKCQHRPSNETVCTYWQRHRAGRGYRAESGGCKSPW